MTTEKIQLCCLFARLFCVARNSSWLLDKLNENANFEELFNKIYLSLLNTCDLYNIEILPTATKSSFNGIVRTVTEVSFVDKSTMIKIPDKVYNDITNTFSIKSDIPPVGIYFGYNGRFFDLNTMQGYVTDGLHDIMGHRIIFDYFTYIHVGYDILAHRLLHELLHCYGFNELEVLQLIDEKYNQINNQLLTFSCELKSLMTRQINCFYAAICSWEKENPKYIQELLNLSKLIYDYGFPTPSSYVATTTLKYKLNEPVRNIILF